MLLGSYIACSIGALAFAGSQGGLQTIKSAVLLPPGNKLACSKVMYCFKLSFSILSKAQFNARTLLSVAITALIPRVTKIAAITPVPVPISNAVLALPNDVLLINSKYSPRIGL